MTGLQPYKKQRRIKLAYTARVDGTIVEISGQIVATE